MDVKNTKRYIVWSYILLLYLYAYRHFAFAAISPYGLTVGLFSNTRIMSRTTRVLMVLLQPIFY